MGARDAARSSAIRTAFSPLLTGAVRWAARQTPNWSSTSPNSSAAFGSVRFPFHSDWHLSLVCAVQDLALLSCDSQCLTKSQRDGFFFCSYFLYSSQFERRARRKATSAMGLFPSSNFTAAFGSIFITPSITKSRCGPPLPRPPTDTHQSTAPPLT